MPKGLNCFESKKARARRRGETEEQWAKRIARLDAQRQSRVRVAERKAAAPEASNSLAQKHHDVPERILEQHNRELQAVEAQVRELVNQLERERSERRRLEGDLSARNHVVVREEFASAVNDAQGYDIIDLSDHTRPIQFDHEIIGEFGDTLQGSENVSRIESKCLISEEVFDGEGGGQ
ncbi:MAG: hypothetical protein EBT03_11145, partial [Betaproteobacteria bacterium]|nr:hypothetical protein [Betaproteobacteria bacterium]